MSYHKECLDKFRQLPKNIREKIGSEQNVFILNKLEEKYDLELGFMVILVMIGELAIEDIPDYLVIKYKIDYKKAELVKSEMLETIFGTIIEDMEIDTIMMERSLREEFSNNLVAALLGDEDDQIEINAKIIYILSAGNPEFQEESIRLMLKNKEKLTRQPLIISGKQKQASISNWLQYFIKEEGSSMPSNVSISNFLINAKNTKILDDKDRDILGKMLILYRNMKFFPKSLENISVDDWYFIPVERSEVLLKAREVSGPPKTEEEVKIEELKRKEEEYEEDSLERRVVDEEGVKNARRVEDLKFMLSKFADGSLEKKAIEEEVAKLEKKIEKNEEE